MNVVGSEGFTSTVMRAKLRSVEAALVQLARLPFVPKEVMQPLGDMAELLSVMVNEIEGLRRRRNDSSHS